VLINHFHPLTPEREAQFAAQQAAIELASQAERQSYETNLAQLKQQVEEAQKQATAGQVGTCNCAVAVTLCVYVTSSTVLPLLPTITFVCY
jgi:hypothetical protein